MAQNCFICNAAVSNSRNCINIFGKDSQVQSKKKIWQVLSGVLEKNIVENTSHSRVLCRKCFMSLSEYDSLEQRLQTLKSNFMLKFKSTLPHYNLKYETYGQLVNIKPKKIVLPASKLQPLPSNYMIDVSKISSTAKSNITFANLENNGMTAVFKVAAASTSTVSTTQSLVTNSLPKLIAATTNITTPTTNRDMASLTPNITQKATKNPMLSFDLNSLPKNFMSSGISNNNAIYIKAANSDQNVEVDSKDDIEIDIECPLAVMSDENGKLLFNNENDKSKVTEPKSNFFDMSLLLSDNNTKDDKNNKFLLDRYTLLDENAGEDDDDYDEAETIVMEGDNATIIRVPAGQRFLYDGKELALVQNSGDDLQDNGDSPDSNDGFELQVSEDEETANAIIAAAQEEGTAYIKVESGEMYRVQSIRTDDEGADNNTAQLQKMVDRKGDLFVCLLCENKPKKLTFEADAEAMMYHLKSVHAARAYICPVCHLVMRKRSEYTAHLEGHNQKFIKIKFHECALCKKKFNSKQVLNEHLNTHTGSRPYACNLCEKKFASKYTLQAHMKTHSARPRPFKCDQCEKTFFTAQNLMQHEKTHLGIKEFICNVCDKAFATQHNLEVHGVVHTGRKPFECPVCSKAFARRAEVRDHMRIHTGERPFACDVCGATFSQRSNLHSHKRATHLDDKRHACLQCPKRFKRRRLLDYHIKAAHTGERPLKCNVCRATFVYPEHYKKHKRIHSGEKPYDCEVCGKSFNSCDNRNTHRFVHSDKKPYECLTCGTGYMRKQLLYQHMNTTGHVAESIVVNQPRVIKATDNGITAPLVDVNSIEIKTNKLTDGIFETNADLHYESDGTAVDPTA